MIGTMTDKILSDNVDDTSLSDAYLTSLPSRVSSVEAKIAEFIQMFSTLLISDALERGEKDVTILDVFETPAIEDLHNPIFFSVRYFDDIDLLEPENFDVFQRYALACQAAYHNLNSQQVAGMFSDTVCNMLDIHACLNKDRPGTMEWTQARKQYTQLVSGACFFLFPVYVVARDFFRTVSIQTLFEMTSPDGVMVDETMQTVLPRAYRRKIEKYLYSLPDVDFEDGEIQFGKSAESYHSLILNGVKNISAARVV